MEGGIVKVNRHYNIGIRETEGWTDGQVVDRSKVFIIQKDWQRENK